MSELPSRGIVVSNPSVASIASVYSSGGNVQRERKLSNSASQRLSHMRSFRDGLGKVNSSIWGSSTKRSLSRLPTSAVEADWPGYNADCPTALPLNSVKTIEEIIGDVLELNLSKNIHGITNEISAVFQAQSYKTICLDIFWFIQGYRFKGLKSFDRPWASGSADDPMYRLFLRIAEEFVGISKVVTTPAWQQILVIFPDFTAQIILEAFMLSFPSTRREYNNAFRVEILDLLYEWITGMKPDKYDWSHWRTFAAARETVGAADRYESAKAQWMGIINFLRFLHRVPKHCERVYHESADRSSILHQVKGIHRTLFTKLHGSPSSSAKAEGVSDDPMTDSLRFERQPEPVDGVHAEDADYAVTNVCPFVNRSTQRTFFNLESKSPLVVHYLLSRAGCTQRELVQDHMQSQARRFVPWKSPTQGSPSGSYASRANQCVSESTSSRKTFRYSVHRTRADLAAMKQSTKEVLLGLEMECQNAADRAKRQPSKNVAVNVRNSRRKMNELMKKIRAALFADDFLNYEVAVEKYTDCLRDIDEIFVSVPEDDRMLLFEYGSKLKSRLDMLERSFPQRNGSALDYHHATDPLLQAEDLLGRGQVRWR